MRYLGILVAMLAPFCADTRAGTVINITGLNLTGGAPTIGQTFTAPDSVLLSYKLTLVNNSEFPVRSQVFQWNDASQTVIGPALFTSDLIFGSGILEPYEFFPFIVVTPGSQYIALITNTPGGVSLGHPSDATTGWQIGMNQLNPYPDGRVMFTGGSPEAGGFFSIPNADAVFRAEFVPEPASLALACIGIAGAAGYGWRRRK